MRQVTTALHGRCLKSWANVHLSSWVTEESWGALRPLQVKWEAVEARLICLGSPASAGTHSKCKPQLPSCSSCDREEGVGCFIFPNFGNNKTFFLTLETIRHFFLTLETIRHGDKSRSLLEELPGTCKIRPLRKPLVKVSNGILAQMCKDICDRRRQLQYYLVKN